MLKGVRILLLFLSLSFPTLAQINHVHAKSITFVGYIGSKPIKMQLQTNNAEIHGFYYYTKYGVPIFADNLEQKDSALTISAHEEEFKGILNISDSTFKGTWINSKQKQKYPFSLKITSVLNYDIEDFNGSCSMKGAVVFETEIKQLKFNPAKDSTAGKAIASAGYNKYIKYFKNNNSGRLSKSQLKLLDKKGDNAHETVYDEVKNISSGDYDKNAIPFRWMQYKELCYKDSNCMSICTYHDERLGGTICNANLTFKNINTKTGQDIKLSNSLKKGYAHTILRQIKKRFCEMKHVKYDPNFGPHSIAKQYFFTDTGIVFVYQVYEVNNDIQYYFVPYSAFKKYIKPDGPLGWVLKG